MKDRIEATHQSIAHVGDARDGEPKLQLLQDHLTAVSERAAAFASAFHAEEWARLAGRWHDLGKYQPAFQAYIRRASGLDGVVRAPDSGTGRVDHSTPGAIHATEQLGRSGARGAAVGHLLAYVIAGHHAGLPDWCSADAAGSTLEHRLAARRPEYAATVAARGAKPHLAGKVPGGGPPDRSSAALWVRMLFSALVDADFLDTEQFMDAGRAEGRHGWRSLADLAAAFERFMAGKARSDTPVNALRSQVLAWCREAATRKPGLFSLTVPTGGGKTLSSMAFALDHALAHEKRRIVYVIPYTSIIEQTADVLRKAFDEREPWTAILEHHSNLDDESLETGRARLASENWDAPVIVTTSVQFFESLFAASTSRARKLHNLVDSVVVLDEVQLLPPDFLHPVLDVLQGLAHHFGTTVLLMSATQPAWQPPASPGTRLPRLDGVREIVPEPEELSRRLRRVTVHVPRNLNVASSWEQIAAELMQHQSALCVVNRRKDARALFELVAAQDPAAIHLSALMCGAHRSAVIADVLQRLQHRESVRVVSTQLVEAGVDLDFPVVFRAMTGLDSIAQAAGRCNREGWLPSGEVRVFVPPTESPPGILRKAENTTRSLLAEGLDDLLSPASFRRFFAQLYWLHGENLDRHRIRALLDHDGVSRNLSFSFRTASHLFRIIPDDRQVPVVVRWSGHPQSARVEAAIEAFEKGTPDLWAFRALQRSTVNISRWGAKRLLDSGAIARIHDQLFVQIDTTLYDEKLGLRLEPGDVHNPEELMP